MSEHRIIPSFDLYKTLDSDLHFEICRLEESYNPYDASAPHRHSYYEILFFYGNGGTHEIDFKSYPVQKNTLHFISPEQVHKLRRTKKVTGFVISFTSEFCLAEKAGASFIESFPFFNNPYNSPLVKMKYAVQQKEVVDIILKIQEEYNSDHPDKADILFNWLSILLITAKRFYISESDGGKSLPVRTELTRKFKMLVESNFKEKKSVNEFAEMLHISAGHLNDTVQNETGRRASDIIHARIILEAKRLLYHSTKSVKEIAYELMYDDPSHFNRFFKTHTDQTPEQFRKHIREKYH